MKKLFTLMVMALVALGAQAKKQLDLTNPNWVWGCTYDAATQTISYTADGWGGCVWTLTGFDKTAGTAIDPYSTEGFDYVVIKIEKSELKTAININYTDGATTNGKTGDEIELKDFDASQTAFEPGATLLTVKLVKNQPYLLGLNIQNLTWQAATPNNPAGTVVLKDAYLATEAEYQEAVEEDKNKPKDPTVDIDIKNWGWGWSATGTVDGDAVNIAITGSGGAYSTGFQPAVDWSNYKYAIAVLTSVKGGEGGYLNLGIKGANNETAASESAALVENQEQFIYVDLSANAAIASAVAQVWLQGENGVEAKFTRLYLADELPAVAPTSTSTTLIDYPTKEDGITVSGTSTLNVTVKIHTNTDAVKAIQFKNGYTSDGKINANWASLTVDGGFKKGDKIEIAGVLNNSDANKQAAVTLFVGAQGEAATDLWKSDLFINGRLVADDPTVQTYTLEADYPELKLGRANGLTNATGTWVTYLKIIRETATGIQEIPVKVINNGAIYNLAGQKVNESYKGIVIKNGKKYIQK